MPSLASSAGRRNCRPTFLSGRSGGREIAINIDRIIQLGPCYEGGALEVFYDSGFEVDGSRVARLETTVSDAFCAGLLQ
jgi:hypothetical protein